jgi:hypothetical protein
VPRHTPLDADTETEIREKDRDELIAGAISMQIAYDDLIRAAEDLLDDPLSPSAWADLQDEAMYEGNWREEMNPVFRTVW